MHRKSKSEFIKPDISFQTLNVAPLFNSENNSNNTSPNTSPEEIKQEEKEEQQLKQKASAGPLKTKGAKVVFVVSVPTGDFDQTNPFEDKQLAAIAAMFDDYVSRGEIDDFVLHIADELQWYNLRMISENEIFSDDQLRKQAVQKGTEWWNRNKQLFEGKSFWKNPATHWHDSEFHAVAENYKNEINNCIEKNPFLDKAIDQQISAYFYRKSLDKKNILSPQFKDLYEKINAYLKKGGDKNNFANDALYVLARRYVIEETAFYWHLVESKKFDFVFYPGYKLKAFDWVRKFLIKQLNLQEGTGTAKWKTIKFSPLNGLNENNNNKPDSLKFPPPERVRLRLQEEVQWLLQQLQLQAGFILQRFCNSKDCEEMAQLLKATSMNLYKIVNSLHLQQQENQSFSPLSFFVPLSESSPQKAKLLLAQPQPSLSTSFGKKK